MKNTILSMVAAMAAGAAFAAANDAMIAFSTQGPDKYADGTTVLDGESYALVWTAPGVGEAVIAADGTVTGGAIALVAPVAKGGRCPKMFFEVAASDMATKYVGGSWSVYLLDTRKFGKDGSVRVAGKSAGINTVGKVGEAGGVSAAGRTALAGDAAKAGTVAAGVEVSKPEITAFRVVDGYVYVTVKGTMPFLAYGVNEGANPAAVDTPVGDAKPGNIAGDGEVTFVTPAKEGGATFDRVETR